MCDNLFLSVFSLSLGYDDGGHFASIHVLVLSLLMFDIFFIKVFSV